MEKILEQNRHMLDYQKVSETHYKIRIWSCGKATAWISVFTTDQIIKMIEKYYTTR